MSIRPVYSTMGQQSPASVAEGTGYYRYRGNRPLRGPDAPSPFARPGNRQSKEKAERFAEFCRLVEQEGLTPAEAGIRIGIAANTARAYERERLDQQRGGTP